MVHRRFHRAVQYGRSHIMFIKKDRWYATVGPFLRCLVVVGEDDGQHPLEILRGVHRMGLFGGHHQRLPGLYQVGHTVYGELTHTFQHGNHSVAGGIMGADLLTGCKGKQGHADGVILRQGFADHLAGLHLDLIRKTENRLMRYILNIRHRCTSFL